MDSCILHNDNILKCMVCFTPRPFYHRRVSDTSKRKLDELQNLSGYCGEQDFITLPRSEHRFPGRAASSLTALLTKLSRFPSNTVLEHLFISVEKNLYHKFLFFTLIRKI
jgi:hypothetical protein